MGVYKVLEEGEKPMEFVSLDLAFYYLEANFYHQTRND